MTTGRCSLDWGTKQNREQKSRVAADLKAIPGQLAVAVHTLKSWWLNKGEQPGPECPESQRRASWACLHMVTRMGKGGIQMWKHRVMVIVLKVHFANPSVWLLAVKALNYL